MFAGTGAALGGREPQKSDPPTWSESADGRTHLERPTEGSNGPGLDPLDEEFLLNPLPPTLSA